MESPRIGVVVIGRNEGERLKRCLTSVIGQHAGPLVYVDSGSTDGSVEYAQQQGVATLDLDMSRPFTMGRARNAGLKHLLEQHPGTELVQFVDGDCEVDDGWIRHAADLFVSRPEVVAACGYLRERHPERTVYNRLFDIECRGPKGAIAACGGPAMYRVSALQEQRGFHELMIAGEEPELCVRLRRQGGVIWRSEHPMALHDADMHRFSQWWTRAKRGGYAYAHGFALQGRSAERHNLRQVASCMLYGLCIPSTCVALAGLGAILPGGSSLVGGAALVQLLAFAKVGLGAYRHRRHLGDPWGDAGLYALSCIVGKFPEALGVIKYVAVAVTRRAPELIEYRRIRAA